MKSFPSGLPLSGLALPGLAIAAAIYLADQLFKGWVLGGLDLPRTGPIEVLPFFDLRYVENPGVSLGMLTAETDTARWLLVAMTAAIALGVLVWLLREKAWPEIVGLGMVLGGALGNIHDRVQLGYVVDYADLHFGAFRPFFIFNIADAAISIGVVIILARSLFSREKPQAAAHAGGTAAES